MSAFTFARSNARARIPERRCDRGRLGVARLERAGERDESGDHALFRVLNPTLALRICRDAGGEGTDPLVGREREVAKRGGALHAPAGGRPGRGRFGRVVLHAPDGRDAPRAGQAAPEIWPKHAPSDTLSRMRMGNINRRVAPNDACVVCGTKDARVLSHTRLLDGERVIVCGSHKVAHRRAERLARTLEELRAFAGDRRKLTG